MSKNWKILIVTANKIIPDYYKFDPNFSEKNYIFLNVSQQRMTESSILNVPILNAIDIPKYKFLGREWAESEVIYNYQVIFNELEKIGPKPDLMGIIHWDFNLQTIPDKAYNVTERITNLILNGFDYISFFPISFGYITNAYNVLMDERKPNCLFVKDSGLSNPYSVNDFIFKYFSKKISNNDLTLSLNSNLISPVYHASMCCSGIFPIEWFSKTKEFMDILFKFDIEKKFDIAKRHRFPGQVMERYIAIDSLFRNKAELILDHRFIGGQEINKSDPNEENY